MLFKSKRFPLRLATAVLPASLLLAGCATLGVGDRGAPRFTPAGQALRVVAGNGAASFMQFRNNGTVTARFNNREIAGQWGLQGNNLCFQWPRAPRECWPYSAPFLRGRPVSIVSDRGNRVQVTRQ